MSWDGYVQNMMQSGMLDGVAILGSADGVIYAASDSLNIHSHPATIEDENGQPINFEANEAAGLIDLLNNQGIVATPPGIWLNNTRYHMVTFRDDVNAAYLKRRNGGAIAIKTNTLIIVGTWSNDNGNFARSAGNCNSVVEEIAEKFVTSGY